MVHDGQQPGSILSFQQLPHIVSVIHCTLKLVCTVHATSDLMEATQVRCGVC